MLFNFVFAVTSLVTVVVVWLYWVRPILKRTPRLAYLYMREENLFAAVRAKLAGCKEKLTAAGLTTCWLMVELWDFIAPIASQVDTSPLTSKVPGWAWPIVCIAMLAIMTFFRRLAEKRNDVKPV